MAVIRPDDLVIIDVEINFNLQNYYKIEIDLNHINYGKNFTRKTDLTVEEIKILVTSLLDTRIFAPHAERDYGDDSCEYYYLVKALNGKIYKLVFCECTDRKGILGIITLHRLRR